MIIKMPPAHSVPWVPHGGRWAISLAKGGTLKMATMIGQRLSWYVLSDFRWSKWSAQHLTNIYDREGVRMQIMLPMYLSWQLALGCSSQILCFPWDRYQD